MCLIVNDHRRNKKNYQISASYSPNSPYWPNGNSKLCDQCVWLELTNTRLCNSCASDSSPVEHENKFLLLFKFRNVRLYALPNTPWWVSWICYYLFKKVLVYFSNVSHNLGKSEIETTEQFKIFYVQFLEVLQSWIWCIFFKPNILRQKFIIFRSWVRAPLVANFII